MAVFLVPYDLFLLIFIKKRNSDPKCKGASSYFQRPDKYFRKKYFHALFAFTLV